MSPREWPFLCSGVEAVRLLAYGRGDMHLERSFLGMLPPELENYGATLSDDDDYARIG